MKTYKGYVYAALAAASYGTNPIFAKPCYADGMNPDTVLLFRYVFGLVLLGIMMVWTGMRRGEGEAGATRLERIAAYFRVSRHTLPQLVLMGLLMAMSSLTLFVSYNYMPVGIASTLLFVYPILVAVIMTLLFHERMSWLVVGCLLLACTGIGLLCQTTTGTGEGETGEAAALGVMGSGFMLGFLMVMLSSLSYAIYLVGLNKTRVRTIASMPVTFYVIGFGMLLFVGRLLTGTPFTLPQNPWMWVNLMCLGLLPTVVSLVLTAKAIQHIGSTQTAIFGALEPVTAVVLGIVLLGETITLRELVGMVMIFTAVTAVVMRR